MSSINNVHILLQIVLHARDIELHDSIRLISKAYYNLVKNNEAVRLQLLDAFVEHREVNGIRVSQVRKSQFRIPSLQMFANAFSSHPRLRGFQPGNMEDGHDTNSSESDKFSFMLHNVGDEAAIEWPDGSKEWWKAGKRHRGYNRPAIVRVDGEEQYFVRGKLHREDGEYTQKFPINVEPRSWQPKRIEYTYIYHQNGFRHRDNDLPAVIYPSWGPYRQQTIEREWYQNGRLYKIEGGLFENNTVMDEFKSTRYRETPQSVTPLKDKFIVSRPVSITDKTFDPTYEYSLHNINVLSL